MTRDDFEEWRSSQMASLFFDGFVQDEMARTKASHDGQAWSGPLDAASHAAYRERHDTLEWIRTVDYEDFAEWMETKKK